MKNGIAQFLTNGPDSRVDLGEHHDLFQFIPAHNRDRTLNCLLVTHPFLWRHGYGAANLPIDANLWEDIVDYC
jgi:hypothetical protein